MDSIKEMRSYLESELKRIERAEKSLIKILLKNIRDGIDQVEQWAGNNGEIVSAEWLGSALKYVAQLEGAVELLEEYDCGSVGGFGKGQPRNQSLRERAEWLLKKYDK